MPHSPSRISVSEFHRRILKGYSSLFTPKKPWEEAEPDWEWRLCGGTVKDHRGYIDINSTEGQGTEITLYFPVTRKVFYPEVEIASIQELMGKGETILVVDDIEAQRHIASEMLEKLGYQVTAVSSGEEAIAYLCEYMVDLLVLDMIMEPGMDGLETYREILKIRPGQKSIIASGYSESVRVKEALQLGAGART